LSFKFYATENSGTSSDLTLKVTQDHQIADILDIEKHYFQKIETGGGRTVYSYIISLRSEVPRGWLCQTPLEDRFANFVCGKVYGLFHHPARRKFYRMQKRDLNKTKPRNVGRGSMKCCEADNLRLTCGCF
jgi:hypothetical protein